MTLKSLPRNFSRVLALAGDSTMTRDLAISSGRRKVSQQSGKRKLAGFPPYQHERIPTRRKSLGGKAGARTFNAAEFHSVLPPPSMRIRSPRARRGSRERSPPEGPPPA